MRPLSSTLDRELGRIATKQHGVLTRQDLLAAGVSATGIRRRIHKGILLREYPGVYRLGHRAPSLDAKYYAGVRACGEGAALSGRAAGHLLGLLKEAPPSPEVTCPTYRRIEGIGTRRARLDRRDVIKLRGIPVTSVPRTIVDLAAELDIDGLALVCHEAGVRFRTKPKDVAAVLNRFGKSPPGIANLRKVMIGDVHVVLSKLELGFLAELRGAGLPLPITNRVADERRVDCRWPEYRVTVELLSYSFHNSRHAWEQDHERRREARKRGDEFRTYTWTDVFEDPTPMLAELRELLVRKEVTHSSPS